MSRLTTRSAAVLTALAFLAAAPAAPAGGDHHAKHFLECAKACDECARECNACFRHCVHLVGEGKKEHAKTVQTCADCGAYCQLASQLSARQSPMAGYACDGCARACDDCARACEQFPQDEHMTRCARECRECAKACREMLKHVAQR